MATNYKTFENNLHHKSHKAKQIVADSKMVFTDPQLLCCLSSPALNQDLSVTYSKTLVENFN